MHKLFDFLDEVLSEILPLLYLVGTTFGTMYFFVGRDFLNIQEVLRQDPLLILVFVAGVIGAFAVEIHSYLQQRRSRQANQELLRTAQDSPNYAQIAATARTARRWMMALLVFQIISGEGFWLSATNLTNSNLFEWGAVLLRGAAIPIFLYGTGYLSRMGQDAVGILTKRAGKMLTKTMEVVGKQWNRRLESSARSGVNLATVAIDLLNDAGETQAAKRVQLIESGLTAGVLSRAGTEGFTRDSASGLYVPRTPKTPSAKPRADSTTKTTPQDTPAGEGETGAQKHRGGLSLFPSRKKRSAVKKTPQERVYALLEREPDASQNRIMSGAGVGRENAIKFRDQWLSEHSAEASAEAVS